MSMILVSLYYFTIKISDCEAESEINRRKLEKKSEKVSIKNRFIATLTHEMRNFVTVYFIIS